MAQPLPLFVRRWMTMNCSVTTGSATGIPGWIRRTNSRPTTAPWGWWNWNEPTFSPQTRSVQYLLDPRDIPMMKYTTKYETANMRDYYLQSRQQRVVLQWFTLTNLRLYDNATLYHAAEMAFDSRLAERRKRSPPKDDSCYLIPIFLFDTNIFGTANVTPSGDLRMNVRRAKFILESVLDLRHQLEQDYQSKLVIACEDPKTFFQRLFHHQIPDSVPIDLFVPNEPIRESRSIIQQLQSLIRINRNKHSNVHAIWDSSIYDPKYVHFGGKNVPLIPNDMNEFRKQIEKRGKRQHPIYPIPKYLLYPPPPPSSSSSVPPLVSVSSSSSSSTVPPILPTSTATTKEHSDAQPSLPLDTTWYEDTNNNNIIDNSNDNNSNDNNNNDGHLPNGWMYKLFHEMTQFTPTLQDLGYTDEQIASVEEVDQKDLRCVVPRALGGGETAAKARLNEYFWHRDLLKAAYTTRDAVMNPLDDSSKFSVYLAHGCISPKFILYEIKRYRKSRQSNLSTFWFEFQLYRREFCKLYFVKNGEKVFLPGGPIGNVDKVWTTNMEHLSAWKNGQTGYPFIDACMRELKTTGCMSKLGRQVTAYFLTHHMAHDWRNGGDWFESQLLDLDIYSNWVNWCTLAGGTGAIVKHMCPNQRSDNTEHYIKLWVPELRNLPTAFIYKPYNMNPTEQKEYNIQLGVDYPLPIIKLSEPPPNPEGIVNKRKKLRANRIIRKKKMKR